uniref:Mitochondrial import inner membrane translocase subunit Tim23 n=1 Tax=Franklinothrips vespiformis TaxID=297892 RepID=A0A481SVW2_FRAVS|nr:hypothetical protein [Franklinothrips vespiformis]
MDAKNTNTLADRGLNITGSVKGNVGHLSPYLNFDPVYLPPSQPEFLYTDSAAKERGRFEHAFNQIGMAVIVGGAVGGVRGIYNGIHVTTLAGQTGRPRLTQLMNHTLKRGAASSNALGALAVLYSGFGVIFTLLRNADDELNTLAAGTASGLFYKSTSGLKRCAVGGAIGLSLAAGYCLWTSRDKLNQFKMERNPMYQ